MKQYFPETTVLPGMFRLVEALYGLRITPSEASKWHPDVRFYAIHDRSGALVGQFYADLYARPSKRGGAWMDEAITRRIKDDRVQVPVAYLNCNFSAPVGDKPALFTHDEVITLFHEFGHGLHHLLTRVDYLGVSGINGIEWDAVELPSQFMENFCWEWNVVHPMTRHADSGAPLPRALFDKMVAAAGRDRASVPISVFGVAEDADLIKRYRDAGADRLIFNLPAAKADEVLPVLDRAASLMRQVGA